MKAFQHKLENWLKELESRKQLYTGKGKWVVESTHHVNVGEGNGLNGTEFAVKSPLTACNAVMFDSREDAEKHGFDPYLRDGAGKPIYMKATPAEDFYAQSAKEVKECIILIQKNNECNTQERTTANH